MELHYLNFRTNHLNQAIKYTGSFSFKRFPVEKTFVNGECSNGFSMIEANIFHNTVNK